MTVNSTGSRLTAEQVSQYHGEGFAVLPQLFTADEVAELLAEADRVGAGNTLAHHDRTRVEMEPRQAPDGNVLRRIYEPCTYYGPYRQLSESAKLLDCVEQLLGPDLEFHYSKINMKPPSIGSVVEWHQDLCYYPLTNPDSVSILIYLDDADRSNGCLQVIPRLHRDAPLDHTRDGLFQGRVTGKLDESAAVLLEAKAGSVIFMHSLTPHASVANTSSRPRKTLILSYRASDAYPVYNGEGTVAAEQHVRLVRGQKRPAARFGFNSFPMPRQTARTRSLYELQEMSREVA